jgi:hypothetical protein
MNLVEAEGIQAYEITPPAIPSAATYLFSTDSGLDYEVTFGRKQNNLFQATIVFGVLNEEFDEDDAGEYTIVNRGETYQVMATVVKVIHMYMRQHPRMMSYEFTGESRQYKIDGVTVPTARTKFFLRYIPQIFGDAWNANLKGNTVTILKQARESV